MRKTKPGKPVENSCRDPKRASGPALIIRLASCLLFSGRTRPPVLALGILSLLTAPFPGIAKSLDLAEDFENLHERQYFLRVGIAPDATAVCAVPHSDFLLHDAEGRVLHRGKSDTPLRFSAAKRDIIPDVYYYQLERFPPEEEAEAKEFAAQAKEKLALPVQVLRDPRKDRTPLPSGEMPPPLPWVVVAGPYSEYARASQDNRKIGLHYRARIFRASARRSAARIQAWDSSGKVIAEATGYLGIRPSDPGDLMRGGWVEPADKNWHNKSAWEKLSVYHGLMEVWGNKNGRLTLVNRVFIEDYLYGVVPPEIGNSVPFEMKKVQAVISRSVAIAKTRLNLHATWHYDLCAQAHCQVYKGALEEHSDTNAAVDATWGQVCVHGNDVIEAVFSRCCGGASASCEDAWGGKASPYLTSRLDTFERAKPPDFSKYENAEKWVSARPDVLCNPDKPGLPAYAAQSFRWSRTYTAAELCGLLKERDYWGVEKVVNIRIARRTPSGLITAILVDAEPRGAISIVSEHKIRNALGYLPSAFFTLSRSYDKDGKLSKVTIQGAGTGHGVGLCQMGAIRLILEGKDYLSVLKHYYEGISVYKIYQ